MDSQIPDPSSPGSEDIQQDTTVNSVSSASPVTPIANEVPSQSAEATSTMIVPTQPPLTEPVQPIIPNTNDEIPAAVEVPVMNGSAIQGNGKGKKRWVIPVVIAGILAVLLAAGYALAFYLPNRPSHIYGTSLKRSGDAVDALVNYSTQVANKDYKSFSFDGKLQATTSGMSMDATIDGSTDKDSNATWAANADIMGEKMALNIRSIHSSGNSSSDIYVQVSGVKPLLDKYGFNSFDTLDGQWISIDHTLLSGSSSMIGSDASLATTQSPTSAQIQDALLKAQMVNKQYIFTTDSSKAVLKQSKYIGKETKDNRSVYHYKVGYNKAHLQSYVNALGKALDASKLNNWSDAANKKKLSETINIDNLKSSVGNAKGDYTFDMWVDTKTRLIHSLQFTNPSNSSSVFTIAQNYTGGNDYPIQLTVNSTVGQAENVNMKLDVNKVTDKTSGQISLTEGNGTSGSFTFELTPSNKEVNISAPSGAKPLMDLLNQYGLGGALSGLEAPNDANATNGLVGL